MHQDTIDTTAQSSKSERMNTENNYSNPVGKIYTAIQD